MLSKLSNAAASELSACQTIEKIASDNLDINLKPLNKKMEYNPADYMEWLDDSKRDHAETDHGDVEASECPTAEVLLQRALNVKTMTPQEETDLWIAYQSELDPYKKAMLRDEFLTRNLRLVLHIAKQMSQKCDYKPIDLMSWGYIGMHRAFEKFDPAKGAKFSTYAAKWIQQGMTRGMAETDRAIRVPYNIITDQGRIKRFQHEFLAENGFEAEDLDICAHFGWTMDKLEYIRKGLNAISSIDVPATDGEDTIANLIEDTNAKPVDEEVMDSIVAEKLCEVLEDTLDERALDIIRNLFGFEGYRLDRDELAAKYGITRERVFQIRDEAISQMRHPAKSRKLRGLLAS